MATFPVNFRNDSAAVHGEHQRLLAHLAAALEVMGPSPLSVDPLGAGRVRRSLQGLQEFLPSHFGHEEKVLFDAVAPVSPELTEFARQMRREHQQFTARLRDLVAAVARLESGDGAGRSLATVREEGEMLIRDVAAHIALEEQQLDGFL